MQPDRRRSRRHLLAGAFVGLLVLIGAVALVLAGRGSEEAPAPPPPTTTPPPPPTGSVELELGAVVVYGVDPATEVDDDTAADVLAAVQDYVDRAFVAPLLTGDPADLDGLFAPTVAERVAAPDGADRGVLTDEGVPVARADLTTAARPVDLAVLTDADGSIVTVAARLRVEIATEVDGGPVDILHVGDLYLERSPAGAWLVTGYDQAVTRDVDESAAAEEPGDRSDDDRDDDGGDGDRDDGAGDGDGPGGRGGTDE